MIMKTIFLYLGILFSTFLFFVLYLIFVFDAPYTVIKTGGLILIFCLLDLTALLVCSEIDGSYRSIKKGKSKPPAG